jgi:flagellar biosynthesis GTPase FlhF
MHDINQAQKTWEMLQHFISQSEKRDKAYEKRILDMNQELSARFKETDQKFKETERVLKETFKETDQKFKETDHKFKETDQKFKETERVLKETFKETDQKFKETSQLIKESSNKADKYLGKINELDRNWGKLVESLVAPSIVKQFQKENFEIDGMSQRMMRRKAGKTLEIDALLTNSHIVIPVEVKTTLNVNAVDEHIQKHLIPFKHFFPEYHNKIVYGAVAYIHVEENADRYAYKKGLYVLTFGDNDMVVIKNDKNFKPAEF